MSLKAAAVESPATQRVGIFSSAVPLTRGAVPETDEVFPVSYTHLRLVPGMLRSAHFIPETRNINSLFKEMQSQKIHMEIVIDEYGQTAGLVTICLLYTSRCV